MVCLAVLAATACGDDPAGLGEPCNLKSGDVGVNTVAVEQGNEDCKSGKCMSFLGNEFCTDVCASNEDCPNTMVCVDMAPMGGSGSWCVLVEEGTELEPSDPIPGSARYHADEALTRAQAEWADDAHLVAVTSSGVGISGLLESGSSAWRYTFLASSLPDLQAEIDVTTAGPGDVDEQSYNPEIGPLDLDLLSGTYWRFDSHDVYSLGLQYGAGDFMDDFPQAEASFTLAAGVVMDEDVALWTLSLIDFDAGGYWIEMFNAETGGKMAMF
jgi:hypothetical protein